MGGHLTTPTHPHTRRRTHGAISPHPHQSKENDMYGRVVGAGTTGAGGATLAATGVWMNSMAMMVAATTLVAAGVALFKLAPRPRRR
ncbi:hypothetical protein ACF09J_04560 [Streptomyces sp. NPDC014889]|uniref:hypothetical protein n=2 Tax=Streptomyces TaxID=1883 RepID=UPI0037010482